MFVSNNKKIIAAAVCVLIFNTSVYANENNDYTKLKAEIRTIQKENKGEINEKYINKIAALYFLQKTQGKLKAAANTLDNYVQLNEDFYGEDSTNTAFAYLIKANLYNDLKLYEIVLECIEEAEEISRNNPSNHFLEYEVLAAKIQYFQSIDQPYDVIPLLNEKKELADKYNLSKADFNLDYAKIYIQIKDYDKASKYLDKYYKSLSTITEDKENALLQYYSSIANLYMNKIDYKNVLKYSLKTKELSKKLHKDNPSSIINDYNDLILYYVETLDYKTTYEYLNELSEIVKNSDNPFDGEMLVDKYIDINKETDNYDELEKYINKKKSITNKFPEESFRYLDLYEKSIDLYNEIENYDKSEELADKALNIIEPLKDELPSIYAKYLSKMSEVQTKKKDIIQAFRFLKEAEDNYNKVLPDGAYQYYEVNKNFADIYKEIEDTENAIKYYKKALSINEALQGSEHRENADLYESLAEMYSLQGEREKALKYIGKTLDIYTNIYGEKHVKTVKKLVAQYNVYNNLDLKKEAAELLNKLTDDAENGKIIGDNKTIYFDIYKKCIYRYLYEDDFDNAVIYAEKAFKYAAYDAKKKEVYRALAQIYEAKGNKFMQYKYEHLAR